MNWRTLLSAKRFGMEKYHNLHEDIRNEFQRDYDRLIFSAPFRRLQNKTQVFPLPGNIFVHNRLTHSLEVSCVGRSIGRKVAGLLQNKTDVPALYMDEIGSIVSAACLAHDMGNPPFGHSGEKAIETYFSEGKGAEWKTLLTPGQWQDCVCFEGNANAFRLLTHQFKGRRTGGFALTYSTLASIVKYPYASIHAGGKGKFGFFSSESEAYGRIADELGIARRADKPDCYARHPLVFLVEAADDICYQVMDLEDAHKLRLLTTEQTIDLLMQFLTPDNQAHKRDVMQVVQDRNEQIAYLRSAVVGELVDACAQTFVEHEAELLAGTFDTPLIKCMDSRLRTAYEACSNVAFERIYRSQEVLDVELAGYKIIYMLLEELMQAVFNPQKAYSKQFLMRIPEQYDVQAGSPFGKIQAVLDYISGMTDVYALDLYRKITGMSLPTL